MPRPPLSRVRPASARQKRENTIFASSGVRPMPVSCTLMDAMMRADLGVWSPTLKGAYVQVNANNIGDREYISGCYGTGNCYWGAERSVIATVGYDF